MSINFDQIIDRRGSGALKTDALKERYGRDDLIAMWVADMDFRVAPCVDEAIKAVAAHGVYGYSAAPEGFTPAVRGWLKRRYGWDAETDWMLAASGVVYSLAVCIRAFSKPGDAVLIQEPVYHCFRQAIEANGRRAVSADLAQDEETGRYGIDFDAFERVIEREKPAVFALCSPHNPVSRVWSDEELIRMGDICLAHGVRVVSDEIHADFLWQGKRHRPFASLKDAFLRQCVTLLAPTKTFNLAGVEGSLILAADPDVRGAVARQLKEDQTGGVTRFSYEAMTAAYARGDAWLDALLAYLEGNIHTLQSELAQRLPQARMTPMEATYLAWIDLRAYGVPAERLPGLILEKGRLALNAGQSFGAGGAGFMRMNVATQRANIPEGVKRLAAALG